MVKYIRKKKLFLPDPWSPQSVNWMSFLLVFNEVFTSNHQKPANKINFIFF